MSTLERIEVGGGTISYERAGSGPALVLLHGGLSDHREWRHQIDGLSDRFTVVAWDTPGSGGSSDPPAPCRMPGYAALLAEFIGVLDLDNPNIVGLSWGSTLALALYRDRPEIPRTLTLAAAYAGWAGSLPAAMVSERLTSSLHELRTKAPEDFVRGWAPSLFAHGVNPAVVEDYVRVMATFHPDGVREMLMAMAEADLRGVLPTIDVPTLLLYGEEDARSPLTVAEAMHRAIPGSELTVLPGVGHMSNLEAPDRFNEVVRSFIERTRS